MKLIQKYAAAYLFKNDFAQIILLLNSDYVARACLQAIRSRYSLNFKEAYKSINSMGSF